MFIIVDKDINEKSNEDINGSSKDTNMGSNTNDNSNPNPNPNEEDEEEDEDKMIVGSRIREYQCLSEDIEKDLSNLSQILQKMRIFSNKEIDEINESIDVLFSEYIENNVLCISCPKFDKNLTKYIYGNVSAQIAHLYGPSMQYRVRIRINKLIKNRKFMLYTTIMPRRSQKSSFIRNIKFNTENRDSVMRQLAILKNMPQPSQRTDEWYVFRHNLLTASSIWKALGSQSSKNQIIYEKCMPYNTHKNASMDSPLHWGQKYEPVSVELYKKLYNTIVSDFGCIQHTEFPFIGASPDGINTDINNPRYGRMLEIKNIVNREIDGNPKLEYWIQMQLQMETCGLNECDFLETKFVEYESEEAFLADKDDVSRVKGRIILFSYTGDYHYEYEPLDSTEEAKLEWENQVLAKNSHGEWIKNIFWKLEKYSCVLVLRNKLWIHNVIPHIEEIWNIILKERVSGFAHRAPKKRKTTAPEILVNKCYIDME